jgi:hypothetical protein
MSSGYIYYELQGLELKAVGIAISENAKVEVLKIPS